MLNTRQKGDHSELLAIAEATGLGFRVAIPFGNSQDFDFLVFSKNKQWKSIQVKTAKRRGSRGNRIYVDTIRGTSLNKKRGYLEGAFDYMIAVLPDEKKMWVIEFSEMSGRRCLTIPEDRKPGWDLI